MKARWAAVAAVILLVASSTVPADDPPKAGELAALEKKLLGSWIGQGPCDGRMVFDADGTYHVVDWMIGRIWGTGTWKIEWNALPPTLILSPTQIELAIAKDDGRKAEPCKVFLRTLNDKALNFEYPGSNGSPAGEHLRGTEEDNVRIRLWILDSTMQSQWLREKTTPPASLKALVDEKALSSRSLLDPWGKEFQYDIAGKKNRGEKPDIWAVTPDKKVIGNWPIGR
jgi:hypothetical protein